MRCFVSFVLTVLLVSLVHAQDFIVKSVCIVPKDASRPDNRTIEKFRNLVKDTQDFYRDELRRYGYGSKTFRLNEDKEGKPVIEIIKGKYSKSEYLKMQDPGDYGRREFPVSDTIYVVLVADVNLVGGYNGKARVVLDLTCAGCRGYAFIGERNGNFQFSTVAHELGHAFGLWHNLKGQQGDQSYLMWTGSEQLDKDEARWLNKSPYFNRGFIAKNPPRSTRVHNFEGVSKGGTDYINLRIDLVGSHSLYQAQAFRGIDHCVLAWDELDGRNDIAEFMIPKSDMLFDNKVFISFIDDRGNQHLHDHPLTIPLDLEVTRTIRETTRDRVIDPDPDRTETYLTLKSSDSDSLTPTNYSKEWGWNWGGWQRTWEKLPNKSIPVMPHQGFMPAEWIPYIKDWDFWFYAHVPGHAPSQFVYDLSDGNYVSFDAYLDIPNPCGNAASIQAIFLADEKEIYKSKVLRGDRGRNTHIFFDIPENTKSLKIKVTDAGDGSGCDHFIFANARLLHGENKVREPMFNIGDINQDGIVDNSDLIIIAINYGSRNATYSEGDVNKDGIVDRKDFILVASIIDTAKGTYSAPILQSLIPRKTSLLPNYPNPSNPETWIPYQLAKDSEVRLEIYSIDGKLIRVLPIGFQSTGFYLGKGEAAYWDGQNEVGELVASGIYFYTLFAGDTYQTEKLLISK